ncbi:MAG: IS21 family transposase [Actinobacteria bacterium]|nr:IS21 family transposase [Actinomycetota bacterium]
MLNVEEWAEIRRLHFSEGMGIKRIARELGVARNTVRAAVRDDRPPRYERASRGSAVDAFEDDIRRLLQADPRMPATVIAERVGWSRGMTVFKARVRELRPAFLPPDPSGRTTYQPGEIVQFDLWQPDVDVPVGHGQTARVWVMVAVAGYSRFMAATVIASRATHDVLGGHLECLLRIGGVPRTAVWDGEGAIGRRRGPVSELTDAFQAFRGVLGMGAYICEKGDPEAKGLVERANGYLQTSFLPGRTFTDVDDFNDQLTSWLEERANRRVHRATRLRPVDLLAQDRAAMRGLPPVLPDTAWRRSLRPGRDHYVRFDTCDYSVHPRAIGAWVDVTANRDWVVATTRDGVEVARHRRCLARHHVISDPGHVRAAKQLRDARRQLPRPPQETDVEVRDLAVYDRVLGVA